MTGSIRLLAFCAALAAAGALIFIARPTTTPPLPEIPPAAGNSGPAHLPFGPVNPRKATPALTLTLDDGARANLADVTRGRWSLVQIIFTNCATTCPLQGAIFQRAQQLLMEAGYDIALLSISIDPDRDDPRALKAWLETFGARPGWRAGVVVKSDAATLLDFFSGRKSGIDVHDARVYFIDPQGRLAYASEDLPDPKALLALTQDALAH